jgi:hypothetical protein
MWVFGQGVRGIESWACTLSHAYVSRARRVHLNKSLSLACSPHTPSHPALSPSLSPSLSFVSEQVALQGVRATE